MRRRVGEGKHLVGRSSKQERIPATDCSRLLLHDCSRVLSFSLSLSLYIYIHVYICMRVPISSMCI